MNKLYPEQKLARGLSVLLCTLLFIGGALNVKAQPLTPALNMIAADYAMAANGLVGTDIYFSRKDFCDALGTDSVGDITFVSLPDPVLGRLQIGSQYVSEGDTVSENRLDYLKFVPYGSTEAAARFTFCRGAGTDGTRYTCTVYTTKNVNVAPVVGCYDSTRAASLENTVYSGVPYLGSIVAYDNDGDSMSYEVVSGPSNGRLKLTDRHNGYYEYLSDAGFIGKDSFTVCVTDKYGNRSEEARITLSVSEPELGEVYADMDGHWANSALISCVRAGVIDAASDGALFYPEEHVSRAEFLCLAMRAAGYSGLKSSDTGFFDDGMIPAEYKGYIAVAEAFGFIDGADGYFYPNNRITRCEAAVMLSRIMGIYGDGTIAVFSDGDSIPVWAADAMQGLHAAGIIRGDGSGAVDAYTPITRGSAVQMISTCIAYKRS